MVYETMIQDKVKEVEIIGKVLGVEADYGVIANLVEELPIANDRDPDREILLHFNHFTDGRVGSYAETLSQESIRAIEAVFELELREWGYIK